MKTYYNEFDKKKCAALKELIADGLISAGDIDNRPIQEVTADDVKGYTRCHFFAGVGLWDYALNLAGWEEDRPVWTGSCPCQPFSSAGRQKGKSDDRHLWPEWFRLIRECSPPTVFGEQVESAIAHGWLDDVYQGLEAQGYAVGAAVLPASAVGAPHRRNRLWFVGNASSTRSQGHGRPEQELCEKRRETKERYPWQTGVWIDCPDGKQRLVEPGIRLLADGYPNRVLQLHCAGDGIVPQVAAEFITAYMEAVE